MAFVPVGDYCCSYVMPKDRRERTKEKKRVLMVLFPAHESKHLDTSNEMMIHLIFLLSPPPPTCLESSRQRAGAIIDATVSAQVSRASEQKDGQEELHLPVILPFPSVLSDSGED